MRQLLVPGFIQNFNLITKNKTESPFSKQEIRLVRRSLLAKHKIY